MTIEDKKQQNNLKNFDRKLKESTGQMAWFFYWMFALFVLMTGFVIIYDGINREHAWSLWGYVCMVAWMDTFLLAPYHWSNESFSQRVQKLDSVSKILQFIPISEKNYICIRMQYLWKFVWKFGVLAMLIVIGSMAFMQAFSVERIVGGVVLFLIGPMIIGYIEVRGSIFF